jgi:RHS repeat-associated protein
VADAKPKSTRISGHPGQRLPEWRIGSHMAPASTRIASSDRSDHPADTRRRRFASRPLLAAAFLAVFGAQSPATAERYCVTELACFDLPDFPTPPPQVPGGNDPGQSRYYNDPGASYGAGPVEGVVEGMFTVGVIDPAMGPLHPNLEQAFDDVLDVVEVFSPDEYINDARAGGNTAGEQTAGSLADQRPPNGSTPGSTGGPRVVNPDGSTAVAVDLDPVDGVTGELVIEETDLELPSSGIPFRLVRTYRSRMDYIGPLGPAWDHSLNQHLFNVDTVDLDESSPPTLLASPELRDASIPADQFEFAAVDEPSCGPLLAMSTGIGTTITFRETSRSAGSIHYRSDAIHLVLLGALAPDGTITWTLTSPRGDVRHFDRYGRLVRWVDTNELGLTLTWTAGSVPTLASVVDAEGRIVEFEYYPSGQLAGLSEDASGLETHYIYDDNGALETATRSDGRSESYRYDFDASRVRGAWIPEGQVRAACATACAPTNAPACTGGGACERPVAEAMAACLGACEPCALECRAQCPGACEDACAEVADPICEAKCNDPEAQAGLRENCLEAYAELEPKAPSPDPSDPPFLQEYCFTCADTCEQAFDDPACETILLFDENHNLAAANYCSNDAISCCSWGASCETASCNTGTPCWESCKKTFLGFGDTITNCLPPGKTEEEACHPIYTEECFLDPFAPGCPVMECETTTEWAAKNGCLPKATHECKRDCVDMVRHGLSGPGMTITYPCVGDCTEACGSSCDEACHRNDCPAACAALDLEGTCQSACTDTCVEESRVAAPNGGPAYGHETDRNYNILQVLDGAGRVYLTNTYGEDITSPDFDSIIHQDFGGTGDTVGKMARTDLVADAPAIAAWADGYAEDRIDFNTVEICPYDCPAPPSDEPRDLYVPLGDYLIGFDRVPAWVSKQGLTVDLTLTQAVPPTLVTFTGTPGGAISGKIERRTSTTNYFATTSKRLPMTLANGVTVELRTSTNGVVTLTGSQAAKDQLLALGTLTLFTDATRRVRAYPNAPDEVFAVSSGTCTAPFELVATSGEEVRLVPDTACSGELWITPMAGKYPVPAHVADYANRGLAALSASAFTPSALSPTRAGYVWRRGIENRLVREAAPTEAGRTFAGKQATTYFAQVPMFSAPAQSATTIEPLYVFHHVAANYAGTRPFPAPSDQPWQTLDPSFIVELACAPTLPDAPRRGTLASAQAHLTDPPGPVPSQATVIKDLSGAFRTYYGDERGRILRVVDHATQTSPASVTSFNYDPIGAVIGIEHPDGARTCMTYDGRGNMTNRLQLPAATSTLPVPEPIREQYGYRSQDSKPLWMNDPRSPAERRYELTYDASGNPTTFRDGRGSEVATSLIALVGGTGSTRFQIGQVTDPSGARMLLEWNAGAGTVDVVTTDAGSGGANLVTETAHDNAGRLVSSTTPFGFTQQWIYPQGDPFLDEITWSAGAHEGSQTLTYNDDGQVETITRGALRTELTYDLRGQIVQRRRVATDGSAATVVECREVLPDGQVREVVSGEGIRARYERDARGRVARVLSGDLGPSAGAWDDPCLAHPPNGASQQFTVATFTYDASGRVLQSTDARGGVTTYRYDGHGRPIITRQPDGTETWRGFDALGHVRWEATYAAAVAPATYRPPAWSDSGLRTASEIDYDSRERVTELRQWHFDGGAIGDGLATTRFAYSDAARTVTRTDDGGNAWVTRYDGAGRVVEERAPDGTATTYAYTVTPTAKTVRITSPAPSGPVTRELALTEWGEVASEGLVVGGTTHSLSTAAFDDLLRPTTVTGVTGGQATTSYDALGRVTTLVQQGPNAAKETLTVTYDRDGRILTRASTADNATTGTWSWTYDALGREISARDPGAGTTTTSYLEGSRYPTRIVDPRNVRNDYTWSAPTQPQILTIVATDPSGPDVTLSYGWDGLGRLTVATRTDESMPAITNVFGYDSLGGKTRETDTIHGASLARSARYDGRGLLTRTDVGADYWSRTYDPLARLSDIKVGSESTPLARYGYSGSGHLATRTLGNAVETRYGYDTLGRLTSQHEVKLGTPEQAISAWAWSTPLDGVPRLADLRRQNAPVDPFDKGVYTIDTLGRLAVEDNTTASSFSLAVTATTAQANTTATAATTNQAWTYTLDGRSGWASRKKGTAAVVDYFRDARDALTKVGATNVLLDPRGAITNDGGVTVSYDALGMVKQATSGGTTRLYRRDALGRVVSETTGANITTFAYDGAARVLRKNPTGAIDLTVDGLGLDDHVATITGHVRQFLHQDRLGSVYLVTNATGAATEWTSYTAYGEATLRGPTGAELTSSAVAAQFGWNGLPHDFALGLVDMRARTYRPTLGRFLSPDPLGLVDGTHRFAFVGSSPLSFRDPSGLSARRENMKQFVAAQIRRLNAFPVAPGFTIDFGADDLDGAFGGFYGESVNGSVRSARNCWNDIEVSWDCALTLANLAPFAGKAVGGVAGLVRGSGAARAASGVAAADRAAVAAVDGATAARPVAPPPPPIPPPVALPPPPAPVTGWWPPRTWRNLERLVSRNLQTANPGATIGEQITLDVTNSLTGQVARIRIDNLVPVNNAYRLVDAKFSAVRDLTVANLQSTVTANQALAYNWITTGIPVRVVPAGARATAAGLLVGRPITVLPFVEIHVNGPAGIVVRLF